MLPTVTHHDLARDASRQFDQKSSKAKRAAKLTRTREKEEQK